MFSASSRHCPSSAVKVVGAEGRDEPESAVATAGKAGRGWLETRWIFDVNTAAVSALLYASIVVAFASYLTWFKLIHAYPVSQLAIFTFLSPVFGVASGVVILREQLTAGLILGLLSVIAGIYVTNYRKG